MFKVCGKYSTLQQALQKFI